MADELNLSEHAARTREMWNADAPNWVALGRAAWEAAAPSWGMWGVPEDQVHILPDVHGLDVLDLGCGTGYWCAWFSRLGASPVGLDVAEAQLETPRALQREHGVEFVRPRLLRVRRGHLVRSVRLDPARPPPAASGRTADLPVQRDPGDALRAA